MAAQPSSCGSLGFKSALFGDSPGMDPENTKGQAAEQLRGENSEPKRSNRSTYQHEQVHSVLHSLLSPGTTAVARNLRLLVVLDVILADNGLY